MVGIPWIEHGLPEERRFYRPVSVTRLGDTHIWLREAGFEPPTFGL